VQRAQCASVSVNRDASSDDNGTSIVPPSRARANRGLFDRGMPLEDLRRPA
jgi:hypothetical protein